MTQPPDGMTGTEIDYEALAKAAYGGFFALPADVLDGMWADSGVKRSWAVGARAVVAALREQGLVVVRRDDLGRIRHSGAPYLYMFGPDVLDRVDAALVTAPGSAEGDADG